MRCKYIRKIFQNEENGYTVALFSTLDHEVPLSARDKFWADKKIIAFTAKGYDLPLTDEIEIEMEGEWETNSHGTQYKVETFLEVVPRTREGILGYLSCGSLKGIGPKTAERIVNRFGLDTLEVMEKYPQELLKIQGISQKKLDRIVDSFGKNKVFRELMTFLSPFHVTPKKANMILQKFRDQSVEIIRKQPYILCSVKGFGFLTVDAIARQCCAATNDPMRISGCVSYVLREAMKQNGHLYLEQEILVKDALKVLNKELNLQPVTETEILKVLYRLVMQDSILNDEILAWLIRYKIHLKVSIDGAEETHNRNRKWVDGGGSYANIIDNCMYFKEYENQTKQYIQAAHVVTQNNYGETFHSVCHLVENLNFKIVDSSIDVVHRWTTDQLDVLADEWEKVLCYYIKRQKVGKVSFVVMRLDMQNILEEERIHFGKWDIEFDKKRMIYDGAEIVITDMQWEILQLLMSDSELSFSIREIAYAMNIEVHEAQKYVEELLKTIQEQTGSAIVQKKEERYSFVEITD